MHEARIVPETWGSLGAELQQPSFANSITYRCGTASFIQYLRCGCVGRGMRALHGLVAGALWPEGFPIRLGFAGSFPAHTISPLRTTAYRRLPGDAEIVKRKGPFSLPCLFDLTCSASRCT